MTPEQLKASILQRAMEGKLVPQDPTDEPASELLKRIKVEKEKLIADGKIKRDKKETELFRGADGKPYEKLADGTIQEVDVPYEIPESWEWVKLGDIGLWGAGATPSKSNIKYYEPQSIPWLLTGDLNDGYITNIPNKISELALEKTSVKLNPKGTVLIAMYGATIGKLGILTFPATTNQACCACNTLFEADKLFLFYFLMSERKKFTSRAEGGAQPNISKEKIVNTLFPLPPLAEQKRIVEQIEKALAKVDDYAESYNRLQKLDKEFPDKLKKSILQYAMQGKLVAQDPNDEPVEVLLEKIRAEKQKLYEEGKLKKKDLAEIVVEKGDDNSPYQDVPYDLPESWEWVRLKTIYQVINGDRGKNYPSKDKLFENGEIPFINAGNIANEVISSQNLLYLSEEQYNKLGNGKLIKGDVIFCLRGSLGKFGIFNMEKGAIASSLVIIRPYYNNSKDIDIYFSKYLASPVLLSEIRKYNNGTAQPNLSAKALNNFFIPLPPLAEQKRIVSKISKIFSVIETLV